MILDGRTIADDILNDVRARRATFPGAVTLGIIVGPQDAVIESFVRIKTKIASELDIQIQRCDIPEATTALVVEAVHAMKHDERVDGIIVQLPMPKKVDVNAVLSEVNAEKDIDGINPFLPEHARPVRAPVARAVQEILTRQNVRVQGARAVVVGAGRLVGLPTAGLLTELGANVSMFTLNEGSIDDLKDADIVVLGAGQPHFIRPEHIKDGVVLIDAGASESAGVIQGDAHPECAEKASLFTPVPGGVGPIAVAMIFKNILELKAAR